MPKVVKTAAEILGTDKVPAAPAAELSPTGETVATAAAPAATTESDAKIAEPVEAAPENPPPGFETPPSEPAAVEVAPAQEEAPVVPAPAPVVVPPAAPDPAPVAPAVVAPVVPPAPRVSVVQEVKNVWRFIKNIHPGEVITFDDGEKFKFPASVFSTDDAKLAAKILKVAARHNIVQ